MFYSFPANVAAMFTTWLPASEYYTYFPELNEDLIKKISDFQVAIKQPARTQHPVPDGSALSKLSMQDALL